jgi:hypothetical protein
MTDTFRRGVPWMILMKRIGVEETDLNVRPEQKHCVAATGLAALALLGAPWQPWLLAVALACTLAVVALNRSFYAFLVRKGGFAFAAGSVPVHLIYYGCCAASVVLALGFWYLGPRSSRGGEPVPRPRALGRKDRAAATAAPGPRGGRFGSGRASRWNAR